MHSVLDLEGGTLPMANAGHMPVLMHAPGRDVQVISAPPGAPLGTGPDGYTDIDVHVPQGASLLFFTDGLVEDRRRDLDEGLRPLEPCPMWPIYRRRPPSTSCCAIWPPKTPEGTDRRTTSQ